MEPPGQVSQHGMLRLRRQAFDDQLALGHADGQLASVREETGQACQDLVARLLESGVIPGVHGEAVHSYRELQEEIRELFGQGRRSFGVALQVLVAVVVVQTAGSPRMLDKRRPAECGAEPITNIGRSAETGQKFIWFPGKTRLTAVDVERPEHPTASGWGRRQESKSQNPLPGERGTDGQQ